ncbi:MAG: molybdopterin-dependent oxidoreductase [Cohaesibacter sp.]|nr:molybdopterin-dependent oxidoreductase [Cohaesibacter sp.]
MSDIATIAQNKDSTAPCIRTTCPYCGVGCGVLVTPQSDGSIKVKGDPNHPANFGRLCSKGSALGETTNLEGRLLAPSLNGNPIDWDKALDLVAEKFSSAIRDHGPNAVAIYAAGQILTEDYYVANKWMKGFVGSGNIDTNSRLCMASSVAGHKRAFGSDTVPGCYEDLEEADLITIVGSNLAWCHPVLFQRIEATKQKRPSLKIVVIDPRATVTASIADMHLPITPDGDSALFNGLLQYLARNDALDFAYINQHTTGFDKALHKAASQSDYTELSALSGLSQLQIADFYDLFLSHEKAVTLYSQGVNQSIGGTDKVNAILNCHLATGRIGKPGMGPFSVTGQPNAMGGREVGGLANMLAAHLDFGCDEHWQLLSDFWQAPNLAREPGLKAVDLFDAIEAGTIKALWIMSTNPVVSMPNADKIAKALQNCPFVVLSDVQAKTDSAAYADLLLPSSDWGEKNGTVTNSERRISRQRPFRPASGKARPDWWQICQVAKRMGFGEAFDYQSSAEIFAEHAALSGYANGGARDFDISAYADIKADEYDRLDPFQWPQPSHTRPSHVRQSTSSQRFFADGRFYHPDGKAKFIAIDNARLPLSEQTHPFLLNTGRLRDQWHTMTRTGKAPRLSQHIAEPFVELHPEDARNLGIEDAQIVELFNALGSARLRVLITDRVQPGQIFVPFHWNAHYASHGRIDALVLAKTDPFSGQPASKMSSVTIRPLMMRQYGFALVRTKPETIEADYWACAKIDGGWQIEFARLSPVKNGAIFAADLIGRTSHFTHYRDEPRAIERFLRFGDKGLEGLVYLAPAPVALSRSWACRLFSQSSAHPALSNRHQWLAGQDGAKGPDKGAIICSCFCVGRNEILRAIEEHGCQNESEIGHHLKAGTNCGSCRSEIRQLLNTPLHQEAAQ